MPRSIESAPSKENFKKPTDVEIVNTLIRKGFVDYAQVGCTITDTESDLLAELDRKGNINLITTNNEHNLPPIAVGYYFGTGRPMVIQMQNSGLTNAGDGLISLALVNRIPMLALVTWRGSNPNDNSEAHQEIGKRTGRLTKVIQDNKHVYGKQDGKGFMRALGKAADAVHKGETAIIRLSPDAFQKAHVLSLPDEGEIFSRTELQRQLRVMQRLSETKGVFSSPIPIDIKSLRDEALMAIVENHPNAAILFSNGYNSRAAQEVVDRLGNFYNTGNMGGTLAIGWALSRSNPDIEVVVVDGDQNSTMGNMKDNLKTEYPKNLYWYILNNGIGASVGTVKSVPLNSDHYQLARVIPTIPDIPGSFKYPRVHARGAYFESSSARKMAEEVGPLPAHAKGFRDWIRQQSQRNNPKQTFPIHLAASA